MQSRGFSHKVKWHHWDLNRAQLNVLPVVTILLCVDGAGSMPEECILDAATCNTTVKNVVFWNVTPCGSCKNPRFGGT
jgi:hypothetical protein